MNKFRIIFLKELIDSARDTRSWTTGLFWALFGPLMMGGMLIMIGSSVRKDIEKPLSLPVQNPGNAPNLVRFLEQHDVIVEPAPADPEAAVKRGDVNVVLVIPDDYAEEFSSSNPPPCSWWWIAPGRPRRLTSARIQTLLERYGQYMGRLRLIARGVSPEVIQAVAVEKVDMATPQSRATILVSVPTLLHYFCDLQWRRADRHRYDRRGARTAVTRTPVDQPGSPPDLCDGQTVSARLSLLHWQPCDYADRVWYRVQCSASRGVPWNTASS